MNEAMIDTEFDVMKLTANVEQWPLKAPEALSPREEIVQTIEDAKKSMKPYTIYTRGTCMDERPRLSGEVRPSAPGGSDVYGLAIAELTGYYKDSTLDGNGRAKNTKKRLNDASIMSGGHEDCAADNLLGTWAGVVITENQEAISTYVQFKLDQISKQFKPELMQEVFENAADITESERYAGWTENSYFDILGDEKEAAVEKLEHVPHNGKLMIWTDIDMYAMDQTELNNRAFELNKPYMTRIENAIANGPEAARIAELALYARFTIVKALSIALPNNELLEGSIA